MNADSLKLGTTGNPVAKAWHTVLTHIWLAVALSGVSNLLLLTPTLYLMGIYQRVVPAASVETLIGLTVAAVAAVVAVSILDGLRVRVLAKASTRLNRNASDELILASLSPALPTVVRQDILKNFDMVRQVVTGPAILALLDTPWVVVFVLAGFFLHPVIGVVIGGFALALILVSLVAQRSVRAQSDRANTTLRQTDANLRANVWRAGAIQTSGMRPNIARRRLEERVSADAQFLEAVAHLGDFNAFSRLLRQIAQIVVLGTAGYLVVRHQAQPAIIFASSLLLGRTLAPFDQISGSLRQVMQARQAVASLQAEVFKPLNQRKTTRLPPPKGDVRLDQLVLLVPGQRRPLLRAPAAHIQKGDFAVIFGQSGAGKSTLLAAIAGGYPPAAGWVRHDGADVREWDPDDLARAIGFSGPDPVLLAGTILENISRFDLDTPVSGVHQQVLEAAGRAGVHEVILAQPEGYATRLGFDGEGLSSGQAHRVALARALYGSPDLVILDEPDAHLDAAAKAGLSASLSTLSASGTTVIVASHDPDILKAATRHFEIAEGELREVPR